METISKIRELYEQYPEAKKDFEGQGLRTNYTSSLETILRKLDENPPPNFSMEALDADSYQNKINLAIVLAHIPAEAINLELGDDALMWTYVYYPYSGQKRVVADGIQRVTGRDPLRMEKARLTAWQLLSTDKARLVRAIYNLNEAILGGIADSFDLPQSLQRNVKEGIELSPNRLNDYSLNSLTTERDLSHGYEANWGVGNNLTEDKKYEIWLDSPAGLTLTYKKNP